MFEPLIIIGGILSSEYEMIYIHGNYSIESQIYYDKQDQKLLDDEEISRILEILDSLNQ